VVEREVEDARRLHAPAHAADPERARPRVGAAVVERVTVDAAHGAVAREQRVEEQAAPEVDLAAITGEFGGRGDRADRLTGPHRGVQRVG
jgi:hypothetical protein